MNASPSPAERARTTAYGIAPAVLTLLDGTRAEVLAHATDACGGPLLMVRAGGVIARTLESWPEADMPVVLEITDLAPVPLSDRQRGRMWLTGWVGLIPQARRRAAALRVADVHPRSELLALGDEWHLLGMDIAEIDLCDGWGTAEVDPDRYAAAGPDPLVTEESALLRHLDAAHRPELSALYRDACGDAEPAAVRALGLDRRGLWLRVITDRVRDVRFDFAASVAGSAGLRQAYRELFTRPLRSTTHRH